MSGFGGRGAKAHVFHYRSLLVQKVKGLYNNDIVVKISSDDSQNHGRCSAAWGFGFFVGRISICWRSLEDILGSYWIRDPGIRGNFSRFDDTMDGAAVFRILFHRLFHFRASIFSGRRIEARGKSNPLAMCICRVGAPWLRDRIFKVIEFQGYANRFWHDRFWKSRLHVGGSEEEQF